MKKYTVNCGQIGIRSLTMSQIEVLYLSAAKAYSKPIKKGFRLTLSFHLADPSGSDLFYRYVFVELPPSYAKRFPSFS